MKRTSTRKRRYSNNRTKRLWYETYHSVRLSGRGLEEFQPSRQALVEWAWEEFLSHV